MTCTGMVALAAGRAVRPAAVEPEKQPPGDDQAKPKDEGILQALQALAEHMKSPDDGSYAASGFGPKGALNDYFLWSAERVAAFCDLETIGGRD